PRPRATRDRTRSSRAAGLRRGHARRRPRRRRSAPLDRGGRDPRWHAAGPPTTAGREWRFQDEPVRVARDAEPIEEPLDRELREQALELDALLARQSQQAGADRGGEIGRLPPRAHPTASR